MVREVSQLKIQEMGGARGYRKGGGGGEGEAGGGAGGGAEECAGGGAGGGAVLKNIRNFIREGFFFSRFYPNGVNYTNIKIATKQRNFSAMTMYRASQGWLSLPILGNISHITQYYQKNSEPKRINPNCRGGAEENAGKGLQEVQEEE